jgi:hypothetical protein
MRAVRRRLQIFLALFLVVMASGTFGFMTLENLSFSEALYYNIVTMSTVLCLTLLRARPKVKQKHDTINRVTNAHK